MVRRRLSGRLRRYYKTWARSSAITGWCLLSLLTVIPSASADIRIFLADDSAPYQDIATSIENYLNSFHPAVKYTTEQAGIGPPVTVAPEDLIVAIGTGAAIWAAREYPSIPGLNLSLTTQTWDSLANLPGQHAAITLEQPASRFMALAALIAPKVKSIGTVYGEISFRHHQEMTGFADNEGWVLKAERISLESNPLKVLSPLFEGCDVFIALPDQAILNRHVAKWALHLGYKHRKPVIGFSDSYTRAGALASIYTSPTNIARQAQEWLGDYLEGNIDDIWGQQGPKYFDISTNEQVARVLGLNISDQELKIRLTAVEAGGHQR